MLARGGRCSEPLFDGHFRLLQQRLVGERHLKVMVEPVGGGPLLDGIAFNVDTALWPDNGVREVQLAYKLDINEFRGKRSLQIIIDNICNLASSSIKERGLGTIPLLSPHFD